MKYLIGFILLLVPFNDLTKIAKANEHKKAAKQAYMAEDYETAAYHYRYLRDSLNVQDENVLLNLANSLYKLSDSVTARNIYSEVIDKGKPKSRSQAHQQLGLMDFNAKDYQPALDHFKSALRSNPGNEEARYNYELLKKLLKEQEEQEQQKQNQDQDQDQENQDQQKQDQEQQQNQQNQDQQNQENDQQQENQENQEDQQQDQEGKEQQQEQQQDQESEEEQDQQQPKEGEESEEENRQQDPSTAEKLEEMNISEEKAKMILEAMKNNEIQYLQQNKRKPTKRRKSGKPDW